MSADHLKGHTSLAEMVSTHINTWQKLLEKAHEKAQREKDEDGANSSYYTHELQALQDIKVACDHVIEKLKSPPEMPEKFELSERAFVKMDGPVFSLYINNRLNRPLDILERRLLREIFYVGVRSPEYSPSAITRAMSPEGLPYSPTTDELIGKFGVTGEHPEYTEKLWRADLDKGKTRRGYWEWVTQSMEKFRTLGDENSETCSIIIPDDDNPSP